MPNPCTMLAEMLAVDDSSPLRLTTLQVYLNIAENGLKINSMNNSIQFHIICIQYH